MTTNFKAVQRGAVAGEVLDLPSSTVRILGHLDVLRSDGVRPLRLPRASWSHFPPEAEFLRSVVCNASGVRILIRTCARTIRLTVRCTRIDVGVFVGPVNHFVAEVNDQTVASATAPVNAVQRIDPAGASSLLEAVSDASVVVLGSLPDGDKDVLIWLPQGMTVDILDVAGDQPVSAGVPPQRPVWIHHGSSISHCASPTMPTSSWPVVAAKVADLELINLGFGGNCMLDSFVADAIARTPVDVFSLKVGVNIVGARSMDRRTFIPALHGFLDRVRQGHPTIPIVIASCILWPGSEARPGPADVEFLGDGKVRCYTVGAIADVAKGALTMESSRQQLEYAVAARSGQGDNIHYLDGFRLYGPDDLANFVMPDALHPEADLYEEMGRRFARMVFGERGLVPQAKVGQR